ncbi:hypothetical protein E4T47_01587 [Aureobasidium subglaciale]|nr:hypothetical protein E4T47_01587 [Aureobasidium subglaciale]
MPENEPHISRDDAQRKCSTCNIVFQRTTHLRRHMLTHTQDKRFVCSICGKSFHRVPEVAHYQIRDPGADFGHRDTLHRHQITHRTNSIGSRIGSADALSSRACRGCATARVRCSRQNPCERCHSRQVQCVYEESDRRSDSAPEQSASTTSVLPIDAVQMPPPNCATMIDQNTDNTIPQTRTPGTETGEPSVMLAPSSRDAGEPARSLLGPTWTPQDPVVNHSYNYQDTSLVAPFVSRDTSSLPATNWLPYANGMDWDFDFYMTQALNNLSPIMGMHSTSIWSPSTNPLDNNVLNIGTSPGGRSKGSIAEESPASMSVTNSVSSSKRHGTFYADGEVSRLTRRRNAEVSHTQDHIGGMGSELEFTSTETELRTSDTAFSTPIPSHTYDRMLQNFDNLCVTDNPLLHFERFRSNRFPSCQALETCLDSYFDNINSTFQVIHRPTASLEGDGDWILCLAMAAMGAAISSSAPLVSNAEAFRTFLQRAITTQNVLARHNRRESELSFMQACMIYDVLELHLQVNINEDAMAGTRSFSDLCTNIKRSRWLGLQEPEWDITWREDDWKAWAHRESQRRVAYCAWLLDSWNLLTAGKTLSSNFSLGDVQTNLPVHEALWTAETIEAWLHLKTTHKQPVGLSRLLQSLYQQQPLVQELGDFAQTVAVHAVCRRTLEIGSHILDPLSGLDAGQQQPGDSVRDIYWLPSDPEYQKWRNKALDCLDSLHWGTHAVIARLQGLEPPVVLHLHMSRLILLVPYQDVYDLICEVHGDDTSLVQVGNSRSRREDLVAKIWLWISKDHYKSRLAIVHAGAMFWYIRHHGTGNVLEPTSLFMASIILWAYGSFVPLLQATSDDDHPAVPRADADEEYDPTMIQIDRPCDDELIQIFIRRGNSMQPHMLAVGNICQPGGALGVLKVGAKLIKNRCAAWPISKAYENLLLRCAQVSARSA